MKIRLSVIRKLIDERDDALVAVADKEIVVDKFLKWLQEDREAAVTHGLSPDAYNRVECIFRKEFNRKEKQ